MRLQSQSELRVNVQECWLRFRCCIDVDIYLLIVILMFKFIVSGKFTKLIRVTKLGNYTKVSYLREKDMAELVETSFLESWLKNARSFTFLVGAYRRLLSINQQNIVFLQCGFFKLNFCIIACFVIIWVEEDWVELFVTPSALPPGRNIDFHDV